MASFLRVIFSGFFSEKQKFSFFQLPFWAIGASEDCPAAESQGQGASLHVGAREMAREESAEDGAGRLRHQIGRARGAGGLVSRPVDADAQSPGPGRYPPRLSGESFHQTRKLLLYHEEKVVRSLDKKGIVCLRLSFFEHIFMAFFCSQGLGHCFLHRSGQFCFFRGLFGRNKVGHSNVFFFRSLFTNNLFAFYYFEFGCQKTL